VRADKCSRVQKPSFSGVGVCISGRNSPCDEVPQDWVRPSVLTSLSKPRFTLLVLHRDFGSRSASVAFLASPIVTYVMLFTSQLWSLVSAADRGSVEDPLHDVTANAEYDATLHTAVAYDLKNVATGRP
jgi:hypothetical protein